MMKMILITSLSSCKRIFTVKRADYNETFAPVAKMTTLRMLLAVANHNHMFLHQMDVKTAFLNGDLLQDLYICNKMKGLFRMKGLLI